MDAVHFAVCAIFTLNQALKIPLLLQHRIFYTDSMYNSVSFFRFRSSHVVLILVLFAVELAVIGSIFKHSIDFTCLDNWPPQACKSASRTLVAIYCVFAAILLFAILFPQAMRNLVSEAGKKLWPIGLNLAGTLVALVPIVFLNEGVGTETILPAFLFWTAGMVMLLGGLALYLAPLATWRSFFRQYGFTLLPIMVAGAVAPSLATLIRPIWHLETVSAITFDAVSFVVRSLGYAVDTIPGKKIIGTDAFAINVAPQCSGVEGFVLVTIFVTLYLCLFRKDLNFPRVFILFPLGLVASAIFNVLRISILLIIGLEGNPELAVGGFHSHAGWLMFTIVALGIIALAQTVPWLQRADATSGQEPKQHIASQKALPFFQDPVVAQILPFAIFMLSALLAQVLSQNPGAVYPLRVLAMAAVLACFWQIYIKLPWRVSGAAIAVGLGVAALWILVPVPAHEGTPPYGSLTGALLVGWYILRGVGTSVFVPIIEELFFRGYLEDRLRRTEELKWKVFAAVVTASVFAALHDRWFEAFIAGLAFSWVVQRQGGKLSDAIVAHAVANAIIFGVALMAGNLAMI